MIKSFAGGAALVAAGYILKRYLDKYNYHISIKNKMQNNTKKDDLKTKCETIVADPVDMNDDDFLETRVMEKSNKFN